MMRIGDEKRKMEVRSTWTTNDEYNVSHEMIIEHGCISFANGRFRRLPVGILGAVSG